jgi:hypothetical protein
VFSYKVGCNNPLAREVNTEGFNSVVHFWFLDTNPAVLQNVRFTRQSSFPYKPFEEQIYLQVFNVGLLPPGKHTTSPI